MRCVFCKQGSDNSRSREHPVPESLGNTTMVLRPGVTCDRCNNYFSRKVERPFLDSPAIRALRFTQGVESKKGRIPHVAATAGRVPVELYSTGWGNPMVIAFDRAEDQAALLRETSAVTGPEIAPPAEAVSRFIAKVAIGWFAAQFQDDADQLDAMVDSPEFDPLRGHARYGSPRHWPVVCRRAYDADQAWDDEPGGLSQRIWEATVFGAAQDEPHFSFALFGEEYIVPVLEPDLRAFQLWELMHPGESPLFTGPFAHERSRMRATPSQPLRALMVRKDSP